MNIVMPYIDENKQLIFIEFENQKIQDLVNGLILGTIFGIFFGLFVQSPF